MARSKKPPPESQLNIVMRDVDTLLEDPDNARDHDPEELARAFRRFGFNDPIEIDAVDGMIAAGHGRKQTLQMMRDSGEEAPAGVLADGKTWWVPVVIGLRSATKREAKAYRIANNKQGEHGGWKDAELASVLVGLKEHGGLEGTGFTDRDLRSVIGRINPPTPDGIPGTPSEKSDGHQCPQCGFTWSDKPSK